MRATAGKCRERSLGISMCEALAVASIHIDIRFGERAPSHLWSGRFKTLELSTKIDREQERANRASSGLRAGPLSGVGNHKRASGMKHSILQANSSSMRERARARGKGSDFRLEVCSALELSNLRREKAPHPIREHVKRATKVQG